MNWTELAPAFKPLHDLIKADGSPAIKSMWVSLIKYVYEKTSDAPAVVVTAKRQPSAEKPTFVGGKYRRVKEGVRKEIKQAAGRYLSPAERDKLNTYWNNRQALIDKDDPVCAVLGQEVSDPDSPVLASYQVSGWFSFLCRLGLLSQQNRDEWVNNQVSRGLYKVIPEYSEKLLKQISNNYAAAKADEAIRAQAHANILARRVVVKTDDSSNTTPAPEVTEEQEVLALQIETAVLGAPLSN